MLVVLCPTLHARKRSKRPRQTKMILTNCAACAAPLERLAKQCSRCKTRYCNEACQRQHWERGGHEALCRRIKRGGGAEQYHAERKYNEAVAVAVEKCADDTKGQTCYICLQAVHARTGEGLVRGCACGDRDGVASGSTGIAHELTLSAANNYSNSLRDQNRFEEAKALLRRTMPVARRVLGKHRPSGRYTHPSRRRARVTSARTCAARAATGKPPGAGIPGLAGRARPYGSVASTSGGPRARLNSSASSTRRAFHEWWIRRRPRGTRGWLISQGAVCLPTGPTGTWKATAKGQNKTMTIKSPPRPSPRTCTPTRRPRSGPRRRCPRRPTSRGAPV